MLQRQQRKHHVAPEFSWVVSVTTIGPVSQQFSPVSVTAAYSPARTCTRCVSEAQNMDMQSSGPTQTYKPVGSTARIGPGCVGPGSGAGARTPGAGEDQRGEDASSDASSDVSSDVSLVPLSCSGFWRPSSSAEVNRAGSSLNTRGGLALKGPALFGWTWKVSNH